MYRPSVPFTVSMKIMTPTWSTVGGVRKKTYPDINTVSDDKIIFVSFRGFGGTDVEKNGVQEQERRKLENMRQEYRQIVEEQGESSRAAQEFAVRLNNQQAVVNRTEREIREYTERLDEIQNASDNASESARDLGQAVESAGRDAERAEGRFGSLSSRLAKGIGKGIATGIKAIGTATVGLASAFLATGEASQEFAEDMGKLEAGFKSVGHSGETAKKSYMGMVGILGETDQSVEAVNHLARLTKSEEELAKWTDIAAGVYGTFGDSLPLEGLTEAANETAKVGKVTGPLADALNWAGISEDAFNESLARCSSEQERATLITETLSKTYEDAAKIYKETNKDLIEARQASAEWTDAMAEVGKVAMPVTTSIKRFGASLLTSLVPGLKEAGEGLRGLGEGIDGSSEKLQSGIKKAIDGLLGKIQEALPLVLQVGTQMVISLAQGVVQALPEVTTTIVSMIPMLAQAIVDLLPQMQTAGFEIVKNIMNGISQMFPDLAVMAVELVSMLSQGFLNGIPQLIEAGFALFTSVVKSLPQVIDKIVSELPKIVDSIVSVLVTGTPKIMEGIIALFNGFVEAIPLIVPKIVQALPTLVQGLTAGLVTIECASDRTHPYTMTDAVYRKLVDLCEDICRRNGKTKLIWISDKSKALAYQPKSGEMLLTVHRWFANKSCPGDWLYNRLGNLASEVTSRLCGISTPVQPSKPSQKPDKSIEEVAREVIRGDWGNGADRKNRLENAGYNYSAVQAKVNELMSGGSKPQAPVKPTLKPICEIAKEVIRGDWGNGADRKARLEKAWYNYSQVQAEVNRQLGGGGTSSHQVNIDSIARRVIRGDFGNGSARRNKLVSAYGSAVADAVQQRVNQILS